MLPQHNPGDGHPLLRHASTTSTTFTKRQLHWRFRLMGLDCIWKGVGSYSHSQGKPLQYFCQHDVLVCIGLRMMPWASQLSLVIWLKTNCKNKAPWANPTNRTDRSATAHHKLRNKNGISRPRATTLDKLRPVVEQHRGCACPTGAACSRGQGKHHLQVPSFC